MLETAKLTETCPSCGANVDVADCEPLGSALCHACGSEFVVGQFIDHYRLVSVAGRGGMGVVYHAVDTNLNRPVALKLLRRDHLTDEAADQLDAEAAVTASINHPHVVKVFTTGNAYGRFYIAMELIEKGTLDELIRIQGTVAETQTLDIAIQITDGLRAAYRLGLIHRDVKPGNILFSNSRTAKIADFGLAMFEAAAAAEGGAEIWGTPYYVSPERLDQQAEDFRSDIYSLGATIFHAIAGRPPFDADDATAVALKHLNNEAVSLQAFAPWVSGHTAYVINRMLLKHPEDRYQSYDELYQHLHYARNELNRPVKSQQTKARVIIEGEEEQRRWGYITFGIIAVCLILGVALFATHKPRTKERTNPRLGSGQVPANDNVGRYEQARQLLTAGMIAEASTSFQALAADPTSPAPIRQWSYVLQGVCQLISGNLPQAREAFHSLLDHPYISDAAEAAPLQAFFSEVARTGSSAEPVPSTFAKGIDKSGPASLSLLIYGLKNLELGDYDGAAAFLHQFESAKPKQDASWISGFTQIATDYSADLADYQESLKWAETAHSEDEKGRLTEKLRNAKRDLRRSGTLGEAYDRMIAAASGNAQSANPVASSLPMPTGTSLIPLMTGTKTSAEARPIIAELTLAWRFNEAKEAAEKINASTDDERRERNALLRKVEWIRLFGMTLSGDLQTNNSHEPLKKRDGKIIASDPSSSNDSGITFKSGEVVLWNDLSPDSVLALGRELLSHQKTVSDVTDRAWYLATYALLIGKSAEAGEILSMACRLSPSYYDLLPLVSVLTRSENLARGRPVVASGFANSKEGPDKAVDGSLETHWTPSVQPVPAWIRVDLGKEKQIFHSIARYLTSKEDGDGRITANFTLQKSSDDKTWSDIESINSDFQEVLLLEPRAFTARYVRLLIDRDSRAKKLEPSLIEWQLLTPPEFSPDKIPASLFDGPASSTVPLLCSFDINQGSNDPAVLTPDFSKGALSIRYAGEGPSVDADRMHFSSRTSIGSAYIAACLVSRESGSGDRGIVGLAYRDNVGPGARSVVAGFDSLGRATLMARATSSGPMQTVATSAPIPLPCWIRLDRTNDHFTAKISADGMTWNDYAYVDVPMNANATGGLVVASGIAGHPITAVFDSIDLHTEGGNGAKISLNGGVAKTDATTPAETLKAAVNTPATGTGLKGDYFTNVSLKGEPTFSRIDPSINFEWLDSPAPGIPANVWSVRWTGMVQPEFSESYVFTTSCDDGARLWVNDVEVVNDWNTHPSTSVSGKINLNGGQKYQIRMEFFDDILRAQAVLYWSSPSTPKAIIPKNRLYPPSSP